MSKFGNWLKKTFLPNKETAAMWGLFGVGGLLTFGGELLHRHIEQVKYENKLGEEVKKQAKRLVEGFHKDS